MIYKYFRQAISLPDYFSLTGLALSVLSIFSIARGELPQAALYFYAAAAFDYSDGKIARAIKREGRFGVELDNLCDVVLYLICPVLFGFSAGLTSNLSIAIFVIYVISGVLRLSRFSITGTKDGYYEGLPVSYTLVIPALYFTLTYINTGIDYMLLFYFLPSFLMLSGLRVKKI